MKLLISLLAIISALFIGFIFPGIMGAILLGIIFAFGFYMYTEQNRCIQKLSLTAITAAMTAYALMFFFGLLGANEKAEHKLHLVETELKNKGYNPTWVCISKKRNLMYNRILKNSNKDNSHHLNGRAIDLYVFDVNGDYQFNEVDIEIIEKVNKLVEKKHPELKGAFGIYNKKHHDYFTRHMIHLDVGGSGKTYRI
jgi:hypothetical protein